MSKIYWIFTYCHRGMTLIVVDSRWIERDFLERMKMLYDGIMDVMNSWGFV